MTVAAVAAGLLIVSVPLVAHHSNVNFDAGKEITMKGTVTEWVWANPHCFLRFDVRDDNGSVVHWLAESSNPPGMARKGPGGRHGLSEGFKRIMRKAGLDLQVVQGGGRRKLARRTFHSLRHSFTSALANAGVPEEVRMKLTGHSSKDVHRGYTHHELETLRQAIGTIPSIS